MILGLLSFQKGEDMENHTYYMQLAIELAKKGIGFVNPNPLVGAVIVKEDRIIGEGYHTKFGALHAEREALKHCVEDPKGATMYVTLEPCCHYGKTPPCTEAIIESGISKVIVGSFDPNEKVAGKGIAILREHGIEVVTGVCEEECLELNEVFFYYIQTHLPYVVMKYAMTIDGKIATYSGKSKWITGAAARKRVHQDRNRYMGIMVGIGTVLQDNPLLTCRNLNERNLCGRNPVRIICDTSLKIPMESQVIQTIEEAPTWIATCSNNFEKIEQLRAKGCEVLQFEREKDGKVPLKNLMKVLGERGIDSILLEGGGTLNWNALEEGIVQKVDAYIAPKIFGGVGSKTPVEGKGVDLPSDGVLLKQKRVTLLGDDILIESEVKSCLQD